MKRMIHTLALALGLGIATTAFAQTEGDFSDAKLESFVVAAMAVDEKIREWNPRIQAAQDEEEAAELREQASAAMIDSIDQTEGISVDEYQQIGQAAQADPELAARITEIYDAQTGQSGQSGQSTQ